MIICPVCNEDVSLSQYDYENEMCYNCSKTHIEDEDEDTFDNPPLDDYIYNGD
jgi:hypothetical protein